MENPENEFGYGVAKLVTWIDPASGWQYGFPMVYEPNKGENINAFLIRKGYPREMAEKNWPCRFWTETKET